MAYTLSRFETYGNMAKRENNEKFQMPQTPGEHL